MPNPTSKSENTISLTENDSNMSPRDLTLIVAATSKMGIGRGGTLPWKGLKKEMAYFARVTKRANPGTPNAVVMGRKTWDSIPPRFRPLKDRTNIVISRGLKPDHSSGGVILSSIDSGIEYIESEEGDRKTFVIGGAQIYKEALQKEEAKRILLTRVLTDFECDTFFPIQLNADGKGDGGWERKSKEELDRWVGETVPEGVQDEEGTKYVFEMWERTRTGDEIRE